jgi:hypothetical protein
MIPSTDQLTVNVAQGVVTQNELKNSELSGNYCTVA